MTRQLLMQDCRGMTDSHCFCHFCQGLQNQLFAHSHIASSNHWLKLEHAICHENILMGLEVIESWRIRWNARVNVAALVMTHVRRSHMQALDRPWQPSLCPPNLQVPNAVGSLGRMFLADLGIGCCLGDTCRARRTQSS